MRLSPGSSAPRPPEHGLGAASGILPGMPERRPKNSELHLQKIEEEEAHRKPEEGVFEIFPRDEDEPVSRDNGDDDSQ